MITSKRFKGVVWVGLAITLGCGVAFGGRGGGPGVLEMTPADAALCLQVNNLDYTANMLDGFLAGLMPGPTGVSALLRGQLGGFLGDPQLGGIEMNGPFGVFVTAGPGGDPNGGPFVCAVVPVRDYGAFVARSRNVSPPDARGVSQVGAQSPQVLLAKQAGPFALVTDQKHYEMLVGLAESLASGRAATLARTIDPAARQMMAAPVWLYVNVKQALGAFGPMAAMQMGQVAQMGLGMPGAMGGAAGPAGPGPAGGPMQMPGVMMPLDLKSLEGLEARSVAMALAPGRELLTISLAVSAEPGTKLAQQTFVRGSAELQKVAGQLGARAPSQAGPEMSRISAMLPGAGRAEYVGTYDLAKAVRSAAALSPVPLPIPDANRPSQGGIAYAFGANGGVFMADIAVPKGHIMEIAERFKQAGPPATVLVEGDTGEVGFSSPAEPNDEVAMITQSPFAPGLRPSAEPTSPRTGTNVQPPTSTVPPAAAGSDKLTRGESPVRIAGIRLVRFSDVDLGILPLGQREGYTLSLVADLPGPAVKVVGGEITKAVTNNGMSLLPQRQWDRRIKFPKLLKDGKTAMFDIELLVPGAGAVAFEELSGRLEYTVAGGSSDVDLGVMDFKAGASGSALGAKVRDVQADPFGGGGGTVTLGLAVGPEAVESVQVYSAERTPLEATWRAYPSATGGTMLKLSFKGKVPSAGRLVVRRLDALENKQMTFSLRGISLAGRAVQ